MNSTLSESSLAQMHCNSSKYDLNEREIGHNLQTGMQSWIFKCACYSVLKTRDFVEFR
jgi:hypothetical protein